MRRVGRNKVKKTVIIKLIKLTYINSLEKERSGKVGCEVWQRWNGHAHIFYDIFKKPILFNTE